MRIIQLVPYLLYGDAIGNEVLHIDTILKEKKYKTEIYTFSTDQRVKIATNNINTIKVDKEDVVIYHVSIGSKLNYIFHELKCKKVIIYHNITPPVFYEYYNHKLCKSLEEGLKELELLKDDANIILTDSEFNRQDLISYGFDGHKIFVQPVIIDFSKYDIDTTNIYGKKEDQFVNILFTGRIAPNKKHEDIIKSFYFYKKIYNKNSRLVLAGSYEGNEKYFAKLMGFVKDLKLIDIVFTGHIPFNKLVDYYKKADVFICMSEHEGFCVPLLESMYFNLPIIAYNCTAIGETMGDSGVLIESKDFLAIAECIDEIISSDIKRNEIIGSQIKRLESFNFNKTKKLFEDYITKIIDNQ